MGLNSQITKTESEKEALQAEITNLKSANRKLERQVSKLRAAILAKQSEVEPSSKQMRGAIDVKPSEEEPPFKQLRDLATERDSLLAENAKMKDSLAESTALNEGLNERVQALTNLVEETKRTHDLFVESNHRVTKDSLEELREEKAVLDIENTRLRQEKADVEKVLAIEQERRKVIARTLSRVIRLFDTTSSDFVSRASAAIASNVARVQSLEHRIAFCQKPLRTRGATSTPNGT
jgi:regulator of replication initiation timing